MNFDDRNKEMLEVLAGERSKNTEVRRQQAVRIKDLEGLLQLSSRLQSETVSAAPTQAEHNALVRDVHLIHKRLMAMQEALVAKLL
ncbi:hypothetical protein [Hoeflea poritis]|uniref:Uncharacterized protein n=1 Tax=Hoeflea poritis TaxID=2993659 RepID=A0ABT4VMP8_9HYPH|nr:hypothetical protein [Hoeflea poritis]MDA4845956.1 hypothetical protein [Hoeflea poritis]